MKKIYWVLAAWSLYFMGLDAVLHAFPLPDTGQTQSYTDTAGEDSDYLINPPSYTKLNAAGSDLADTATSWVMVRDNVTGLIWEVKTDDGSIHDKDNTYTWYDPNSATNGGNAGTPGDGTDTADFIAALNAAKFGGYADWRIPTFKELDILCDLGRTNPAIDTDYFPNTLSSNYWSSTTNANNSDNAWNVNFNNGNDNNNNKSSAYYVRAVRAGQSRLLDHLIISEPAQGSVWDTGNTMAITWDTQSISGNVKISISRQGGKDGTFTDIDESTENDGAYTWTVTGPGSVNCVLKIEPLSDTSKSTTQGLFSINGQPTTTTTPATSITASSATLNAMVKPKRCICNSHVRVWGYHKLWQHGYGRPKPADRGRQSGGEC